MRKMYVLSYLFVALVSVHSHAANTPNFILVLTDDHGWTSLSTPMDQSRPWAKSDYYRTPNMDALVNSGMRFSNGYAAAPVCAPSRYSLQFGQSSARLHRTWAQGKNQVDHNQMGIAQVLKAIDPNYRAAHFGKWHIDASPDRYGYDVHDGITKNREGDFVNNQPKRQWRGYADEDPKRVYSLTQRTIEFIKESVEEDRPFFVQLSHYAVHSNLVYSQQSFDEVGRWKKGKIHNNHAYAAMTRDLDLSVGALLEAYDALGLADNTYIIFTADNGGMPVLPLKLTGGKPYKSGLNMPLRRGKWDLTEGGLRVPFAIRGPGIQAGSQSDTPVVGYDLLPTLADLAGSSEGLPAKIDGGSLRPLLSNPEAAVQRSFDGLVFHFPHYNGAGLDEPHSALRSGDYKLLKFHASNRSLLFKVDSDVGENTDLSDRDPARKAHMEGLLAGYLDDVDAERPDACFSWTKRGRNGSVKTLFLNRYLQ